MDLYHRKRYAKKFAPLFWLTINCFNAFLLSTHPARAQVEFSPIDELPLGDLTGITFQNLQGARFEVDLPDGTRCSSQDGTPATFNIYGGSSERQDEVIQDSLIGQNYAGVGGGYAFGAAITIPLHTRNSRNCDEAYELSIANKKIELATTLRQEGLLSDEDLSLLLKDIRKLLLKK